MRRGFSNGPSLLTQVQPATIASKAITNDVFAYSFNAADSLTQVSWQHGVIEDYTYDGDGLRIKKIAGSDEIVYIRDPAGNVIAEYDQDNTLLAEYVYANGHQVAKVEPDGGAGEDISFFHSDHLGTALVITDESGALTWRGEYYPFGEEYSSEGTPNRYRFVERELDTSTGLSYMRARYYNPHLGRFMSVDPVGGGTASPQSWNRYAYVLNNPLMVVDPDGKSALAVTYPDYRVQTPVGRRQLGHSAVVLINPETGFTRYFEYGRYDAEGRGIVRSRPIPNVVIGEDGRPTQESMDNLMRALSERFGQGGAVEGAFFQDADFVTMLEYAEDRQTTSQAGQGERYSLAGNNCATFCEDVLDAGGVDTPVTVINSPRNVIEELQDEADAAYRYAPSGGN